MILTVMIFMDTSDAIQNKIVNFGKQLFNFREQLFPLLVTFQQVLTILGGNFDSIYWHNL